MKIILDIIEYFTKHTIIRYLIGGGTAAVVNLGSFYIFNSVLGIHYLTASVIAFIAAFFVSLGFHKFWTFRDHSTDNLQTQGFLYLLSSLFGLGVNTLVLYVCVKHYHLLPLLGQFIAGVATACCTFPISKYLVFKK